MAAQNVMITGVYGLVAGAIYKRLLQRPDQYDVYGLARRRHDSERVAKGSGVDVPEERFTLSDLQDLEVLIQAFEGMDVVVHMAADPSGRSGWDSIRHSNITGAYNVFEACRLAGVKRIVFASTIQTVMGYRRDEPYGAIGRGDFDAVPDPIPMVTARMPARPLNIYASSKAWGEGLGRVYADVHGLSVLCIRIGWVRPEDRPDEKSPDIWCSQRDIVAINECCINALADVRYDVFFGMSNNRYRWVDVENARERVGYTPQDRAEDWL